MSRKTKQFVLEPEQRAELERLVRTHTTPKRMAERAQIILWGAEGQTNVEMAKRLRSRVARICNWRSRFGTEGLEGLFDEPRPGQPRKYSAETERTILGKLDESPPKGYAQWNGKLLAQSTGIPDYEVWAVLRNRGISLLRDDGVGVSRRTLNLHVSLLILLDFTWTLRKMPSCCVWMKSQRFKRWRELRDGLSCPMGRH